jgi:hypothetical protein
MSKFQFVGCAEVQGCRWGSLVALIIAMSSGCSTEVASGTHSAGLQRDGDQVVLRTEEFTVPAGEERYVCYAITLDEEMVVSGFHAPGIPVVHHSSLMRALVPEPEGLSECPVLFKVTWETMFGGGAGDTSLEYPAGTAQTLEAGEQLVLQLHLLNVQDEDITLDAYMEIMLTSGTDLEPIYLGAIGNTDIRLPPGEESTVQAVCEMQRDARVIAFSPHMHQLGTAMVFEVGDSMDSLQEIYRRDPYDFDNQFIDPVELQLEAGQIIRNTCTYINSSDDPVVFGESSLDEMCYMVTYTVGQDLECRSAEEQASAVERDPAAGQCGEQQANAMGVGELCTEGGGECASGLLCSADQGPSDEPAFCLALDCESDEDCGGDGATCCSPVQAGGLVNVCMPEACRPSDCIPQ